MNAKKISYFIVCLLLTGGVALAQETAPPATAPPPPAPLGEGPHTFSFFFDGGSFLGVYAEDVNKENMSRFGLREARGVVVTQVIKDSPAEKSGLKKDDVILRFEGDSVTSVRKLNRLVSEVAPDHLVRLGISRGGSEQEIAVTMGKRSDSFNTGYFKGFEKLEGLNKLKGLDKLKEYEKMMPPGANVWTWEGHGGDNDGMVFALGNRRRIGVTTTQLTKQLAEYFGIADGKGVLVSSVEADSPAAKAGLKAGDVITAIDGEKVEGAGDLARGINKKKEGDVTLTVVRDKSQRTVTVTPKEIPTPTVIGQGGGRTIVIPRVELGEIPAVNIQIPRIVLPTMPEINVVVPGKIKGPKVKVIRSGAEQPI